MARSSDHEEGGSISGAARATAGGQLKEGLEQLAERLFQTMIPGVSVTQAMREFGAGVLTSGLDDNGDFAVLACRTVEIMLRNADPPIGDLHFHAQQ
jgi:hypothetical protein